MCAKFGCGPTVVSKKGGGDTDTHRQRDTAAVYSRLAGYPASHGFPPPPPLPPSSLSLITWLHPGDICIVIAQDIFSKLDAETASPESPPPGWVGMTGYKMNGFLGSS